MTQLTGADRPVPQQGESGRTRRTGLLAWGAAASVGLMVTSASQVYALASRAGHATFVNPSAWMYAAYLVPVVALLLWRARPDRSWAWLLAAGALCALPGVLLGLAPTVSDGWLAYLDWLVYSDWGQALLSVIARCSQVCTFVGLLGAGGALWRAGSRGAGSALAGVTVAMQVAGTLLYFYVSRLDGSAMDVLWGWLRLVLVSLALAGVAVAWRAAASLPVTPPRRPGWPVTIGAAVAAVSPLLLLAWPSGLPSLGRGESPLPGVPYGLPGESPGNHLLYVGLAFLVIGVVAGAVGGARVLLAAAPAGVLLGTVSMSVVTTRTGSGFVPIAIAVLVVGVAAGVVLSWHRWRALASAAGLGLVGLGYVLLLILGTDDDVELAGTLGGTISGVLIVLACVGGCATWATVSSAVSERAEEPLVLAGMVTPFTLGTIALIGQCYVHPPDSHDGAVVARLLPGIAGVVVVLVLLAILLALVRGASGHTEARADEQGSVIAR